MTRFDPNLRLSRLVVFRGGSRAYDERFHAGVNIIRGIPGTGNSVGKSTIADLIFYALGGDLTSWKDEAALCNEVYAEVVCNGSTLTLQRDIVKSSKQPMRIYFGDFEEAIARIPDGWQRYSYSRLGDKESFSQVLFRALNIPEVQSEAESNITMHQLLRVMYVDQLTPVDRIFRLEGNDSALRRQAVGDLLCGVLDRRIYPAQLELREIEKQHQQLVQQYRTLQSVLGAQGEGFNLDFVQGRIANIEKEISEIAKSISEIEQQKLAGQMIHSADPERLSSVKRVLDQVNADLTAAEIVEGQILFAISDADLLIGEIKLSLARLVEGQKTVGVIGPMEFSFCPSCFATTDEKVDGVCQLCRKETDPAADQSRIARMKNELEQQLKESLQIQASRRSEVETVTSDIHNLRLLRQRVASEYASLSLGYTSDADLELTSLARRSGYLDRELAEARKELKIAAQLQDIADRRENLSGRIDTLRQNIALWSGQRDRRQAGVYSLVASFTADILGKDLHTEEEFTAESEVYFNFAEDRVTVNGKSGFSASSLTVLRNAFHLALLQASCKDKRFAYPRFMLMDNIEDKGMTQARSQRFQKIIYDISNELDVEHQIIFTTSMISEEMEASGLTVGEMYTFERKSLRIN